MMHIRRLNKTEKISYLALGRGGTGAFLAPCGFLREAMLLAFTQAVRGSGEPIKTFVLDKQLNFLWFTAQVERRKIAPFLEVFMALTID